MIQTFKNKKDYEIYGFKTTERKSIDNSYWQEVELDLSNQERNSTYTTSNLSNFTTPILFTN